MQEALGDEYVTWRQLIPEGYAILPIQEGSMFYMAQSIPAEMAEELFSGALEELGVKKDDLKKVFAKGQPFKQLVIKQELVDTIRQMELKKDDRMAFLTVPVKAWKQWTLLYIRKWFKYNARNITGDLDGVIAGNPTSIRKLGQSFKELYEHMVVGKPPAPMLKEFIDRGALKGTMTVQEMGDINKLKMFVDIMEQKGSIKQVPLKIWQSWWKFARISTDFREAILRYASFLDYIDQMNNNRGIPKNFGASKRSEVMALHNTYDRAFKLQNDLLGAYDEISVMGQWLREHLLPFWSWNEVNFRRYTQLIRNAADDHEVASMIGRTVLGKVAVAPLVAYRVGRLVIKVAALWGILIAWNALMFGDLEDDLPEEEQNRPHIIFGRDENGNVKYFSRLGAISDFLDWFGIDGGSMENVKAVLNGEKTIKEVALQMAKSPVNKLMSAVSPFYKTPMELVAGKKTYPDLFKPGNIPDNWLYLAQSVGLDQEYRAIKGLPMRKNYAATWDDVFAYRTDPQENAYYAILDLKSEFERKQGKAQWSGGGAKSEKSDALYWYKQAIRYKDSEAAKKYLLEYMEFGGTGDGLQQSLDSMYPLSGLKKEDQTKFLKTLDSEEKIKLKMAEQYYETIASGSLDLLLKQTAAGNLKSYPGATDNIKLLLKERKSIQSSGSKYKEQELEAINKAIASAVRATIEPKKLK
jgi:hypothetical protein